MKQQDGFVFTLQEAAVLTMTDAKSVSNTVVPVCKSGGLVRRPKPDSKEVEFVINANALSLHYAKYHNGAGERQVAVSVPIQLHPAAPTPVRRKARPPFIIAIDSEIAEYEAKIRKLKTVRREFV